MSCSANVGRPSFLKNEYLENKIQAQRNKARGQGAAPNANVGVVSRIAAEMNRDLEAVRRRNLSAKEGVARKPPTAFKKPFITRVGCLDAVSRVLISIEI